MYPTNTFLSKTFSNISVSSGAAISVFDSNEIPEGGHIMVLGLIAANKSTTSRSFNLTLKKSGSNDTAYILFDIAIPTREAFEMINGNKVVINRGDTLKMWTDSNGVDLLDVVVSYVVYTPAS